MSASVRFPADSVEFGRFVDLVERHVDASRRLPEWPFRTATGFVTIYEYDRVLGGSFGRVLEALVSDFGDSEVNVVGVVPESSYYLDGYDMFPAFVIAAGDIADGYLAGLRQEPDGDPTGALGDSLDVVAMAGSSGAWAVWAQRDWEIGVLLTSAPSGAWRSVDVPWFGPDADLDSIRSPAGWGLALSEADLTIFRDQVHKRGSGR
jgi:hypothetical protein